MKFKRHILMTSAAATLALGLSMGVHAYAQDAADGAAPADDTTVVVTGIRKSLQSALKQKRNADRVEEVITAEDIGKFPDKNVADSLARATGVNVVTGSANAGGFGENERISIRGTDPNLNLTLMDGHNMATGDWFVLDQTNAGRSFNYTMLPSEVVGSVEVIKASSADLPEGGVGGTVDVHVRKPLDMPANSFALSAQGMYATLADKWEPNISGMYSWKNDGHTLGILVGAYYEAREFRRDGQEVLGYNDVANFAGSGQTMAVPSLIGSAYFTQKRVREGGNFMVQWKPSDTLEFDFSGLYTHLEANNENHNFMLWGSKLSATTPTAYTTATNAADSGKTYVTSASWDASATTSSIVQDDIFRQAHSDSYDLNVDMTWHPTDKWAIKGQLGFTSGNGITDDTAAWETYWNNVGASYDLGKVTQVAFNGLPSDPTSAAYLNNNFSWSWGGTIKAPDREAYAKIDVAYDLGDDLVRQIKFGARATDHYHGLDYLAYSWGGNGAYSGTNTVGLGTVFTGDVTPSDYGDGLPGSIPGYSFANGDAVYKFLDENNGGRKFGFYAPASFAVREKSEAYYVMAKLGGDKWRGDVGLRAVHTDTTAIQYTTNVPVGTPTIPSVFGAYAEVDTENKYWDILPSANFTYRPSDELVFRAGAASVMSRPGYAQLAGAFTVDSTNFKGTAGGNPTLMPFRAWQYNAGVEYYYGPEALVSFTLFDLQISNFTTQEKFYQYLITEQTQLNHDNDPVAYPDPGAVFEMTGPTNGGGAKDAGFEFNLQQPLAYGFGFIFNYTYSNARKNDGSALDGNSENTANLTGYFENEKISTRLAYNYRSKFVSGLDRGAAMWQDNYGTLDGSFSYNLSDHIALTVDAQNLLHEKLYYFVGSPQFPRAIYDNGQSFYVGARFKY
ncbi:MAG: TonB-dependent receptor [Asticcacaulis sp.]|nr:TonB-dependent receptor [Asticcacaulis sp.]